MHLSRISIIYGLYLGMVFHHNFQTNCISITYHFFNCETANLFAFVNVIFLNMFTRYSKCGLSIIIILCYNVMNSMSILFDLYI